MLHRLRHSLQMARFNRAIAGILRTEPLVLRDAPWCIVTMMVGPEVPKYLPMYLLALKSLYRKLGCGKVAVLVDRNIDSNVRRILTKHVVGIELVPFQDLPTGSCQRGGCWERLVYCLDRAEREYTIQLDSDTLTVGDISEVLACAQANRAFTMSDGFERVTMPEAAEMAGVSPWNSINITTEKAFERYPGTDGLYYVRGSAGFAGFAKGGFPRAGIEDFHRKMERLVGEKRWREWGSEQCASNFAVANSPNPMVLPYPEYASFTAQVPREAVRLFHFIGTYRFLDGYFARRGREVVEALTSGVQSALPPAEDCARTRTGRREPLQLARNMVRKDATRYAQWTAGRRPRPITVQLRARTDFESPDAAGPKLILRGTPDDVQDVGAAGEVFADLALLPPVWIPPERVTLVVDIGADVGMSCLWWLAYYKRARVIASEREPARAAQALANIELNGWGGRVELHRGGPEALLEALLAHGPCTDAAPPSAASGGTAPGSGCARAVEQLATACGRIDILKIGFHGEGAELLDDARFASLDVSAVAAAWRRSDLGGRGGRDWCIERLSAVGFTTYVTFDQGDTGVVWGYRARRSGGVTHRAYRVVEAVV